MDRLYSVKHAAELLDLKPATVRRKIRAGRLRAVRLDGLRVAVDASLSEGATIGWCHVTDTGPVQVLYQYEGGERWQFLESVKIGD